MVDLNRKMRHYRQDGFTLIELMVSLVLGLLVTGIVIAMFTQTKRGFNQDDAISVMQENGRFALQLLENEILHAGFAGNMHVDFNKQYFITIPDEGCTASVASAFEVAKSPVEYYAPVDTSLNCFKTTEIKAGTNDTTEIKAGTNALVVKRMSQGSSGTLQAGNIYFATEGIGGTFYTSTSTTGVGTSWEYIVHIYYIANNPATNIPGLYRKKLTTDGASVGEEIVPGIANFAIQFGVDDNPGDNIAQATAYKVTLDSTDAQEAVTARISVLAHSVRQDFSKTNERKYSLYPSETTRIGPHYYGRVFSTTAMIRNNAYRMSSALIVINKPGT